jgi:hypothetical protein
MTNFITQFKIKARNKSLTSSDMLALAIYKAIHAKGNKEEALVGLVKRTFTAGAVCAHRQHQYQAVGPARAMLAYGFKDMQNVWSKQTANEGGVLGVPKSTVLSPEEIVDFQQGIDLLSKFWYTEKLEGVFDKEFA